jgi:HSP20 family protein
MPTEMERWEPFREIVALRNRIDQMIENTFARPRGEWLATIFEEPAVDLYENDGRIKLDVPLPGVKPEEVELTVTGNTLTIKGERKSKEEVKKENYYRHETHYGAFTRTVPLPEIADMQQPEATFERGVLTVSFPKLKTVEPKRIEIKTSEPKALEVGETVHT